jgi:hypothetical protein
VMIRERGGDMACAGAIDQCTDYLP